MTAEVVNIHAAKTHLSRLLEQVEAGQEVVIARAGRPIARLVPFVEVPRRRWFGAMRDEIRILPGFDDADVEIQHDFEESIERPFHP